MARKLLFFLFLAGLLIGLVLPGFLPVPIISGERALALDKVKLGTSVKIFPIFYLPPLTAEERGFFRANGLDVEWVPFAGGAPHTHAIAAGAITIGLVSADLPLMAADRGLPVIMVAELVPSLPFLLWVKGDSPYRHPKDLKGAKIAVTTLGASAPHTYARIIMKANGMEKDVRFVGAGGVPNQIAGLKVGAFGATVNTLPTVAGLKLEGLIRELASPADYLPKPWFEHAVYARKDYLKAHPDIVRRMIKSILQSVDFMRKNPGWTIEKVKSFQGVSGEAAKLVYDSIQWTRDGQMDRRAVENVRNIFIEYGIITEKAPAVDDLFTNDYVS